jgi:hypothetical protein
VNASNTVIRKEFAAGFIETFMNRFAAPEVTISSFFNGFCVGSNSDIFITT